METYQIKWTARAKRDLQDVYSFYTEQAGEETAFQIIDNLLNRVDILADRRFVTLGATDEQFKHLKRSYKKLIDRNLKVTYRLSSDNACIYINRVFDTRQHPHKNR